MSKVNLTPPRVLDVVGHKTNNGVKSVETTRWVVSNIDLTSNSSPVPKEIDVVGLKTNNGVKNKTNNGVKFVETTRLPSQRHGWVVSKPDPTPNPSPKGRGIKPEINGVNSPLERGARLKPGGVCKINIGLFGFGCVGKGLYDVLNHSQGLKAGITKICVKDKTKPRTIPIENFTFTKTDVLESTEHDLIVELIDDSETALEIITNSLLKGRDVVTAGKKVVAENFELLYRLQEQTGASLLYEAACAGSIPIIRTLEEYYDNELLSSVKGILNGSSNYILTKMEQEKLSYSDALKQAQSHGFAESDPALDVNGTDAKYKLCLLAAHAFGVILKPEDVFSSGIHNISEFDIGYAAQNHLRIKLVAEIRKTSTGYRAYVLPRFVPADEPLANINYEFNAVEVEGVYSDKQLFTGKGAGSHPTGSAVLSDISAITYNYRYGYKKLKKRFSASPRRRGPQSANGGKFLHTDFSPQNGAIVGYDTVSDPAKQKRGTAKYAGGEGGEVFNIKPRKNFSLRLYIRYSSPGELAGLDIRQIHEEYRSAQGSYIVADVGFESLRKLNEEGNGLFVGEV